MVQTCQNQEPDPDLDSDQVQNGRWNNSIFQGKGSRDKALGTMTGTRQTMLGMYFSVQGHSKTSTSYLKIGALVIFMGFDTLCVRRTVG
jgi:hypothetical protein